MSNADGNKPDPNELNLPGDDEQWDGGLEELDVPDADSLDPMSDLGELDLPDAGDPLGDLAQPDADSPLPSDVEDEVGEETPLMSDAFENLSEDAAEDIDELEAEPSKSKKKRTKKSQGLPKEGIGLAGVAVFGACGVSVLSLLALDVMIFLKWGFLLMLLMNVFWLVATAIPFIMWMGRKTLNFYEVVLGISLAGIIVAVALLLVEIVNYGGEVTPKGGTAAAVQLGADSTTAVA